MKPLNFLRNLFRKTPNFVLPKSCDEIGEYAANFERAVVFTSSCGFSMKGVVCHSGDILDPSGDFVMPALHEAGVLDLSKSAAQCLKWCHYLAPAFERHLGCRVWVTLGQIWKGNAAIFNPTWDDMRRWSKDGFQLGDFDGRKGMNLHAWLTVESGEIIDPTLPSSIAACGSEIYVKLAGAVVWGRGPQILGDHRYFPMAVGREFTEAISEKSVVPLLANNPDELHKLDCYAFVL